MSIVAISLLTKTGVQGDGKDKVFTSSEQAAIELSDSIGSHNVTINRKGGEFVSFTVRGWQLEGNVPVPSSDQIAMANKAIDSATKRYKEAVAKGIESDTLEVSSKLGERIAVIMADLIKKANAGKYPYTLSVENWIKATINDDQLQADIDRISA